MRTLLFTPILIGAAMVCGAELASAADLSYMARYKDSSTCDESPGAMKERLTEYNKLYGFKGYNFNFPPMQDSILQDYGCWRSTLARYGIGVQDYNFVTVIQNVLNYPAYGAGSTQLPHGPQSDQQYAGQRLTVVPLGSLFINYDLGRVGLPGGQLQITPEYYTSSWDFYSPTKYGIRNLAWYQVWFNGALETKIGLVSNNSEWVGSYVGGNFANPLGASSAIPVSMGMSTAPSSAPTARATWHITDTWYDQFMVQRSLNPAGPTGNILYDDAFFNPTSLKWSVPNGGVLVMNEFGYKNEAGVGNPKNWLRLGYMFNTSDFHDYRKGLGTFNGWRLATDTQSDVSAYYALYDRQIWQLNPSSAATAYQGIYAGASFFYAPPSALVLYQDVQIRIYGFGLLPRRPFDQISFTFDHNNISPDLAHNLAGTGTLIHGVQNVWQMGYTYKVNDGIYATFSLSYTDHPVITYNKTTSPDAHDLNFNFVLLTNF